jgi:5-hydroxyisourate hydrolase
MAGRLTTHVLDTAQGKPAVGVTIKLMRIFPTGDILLLKSVQTNGDGRTDTPLLEADEVEAGVYELIFLVGDYFRTQGTPLNELPFLDSIPVRFGISDTNAHYHVPLLVSPWAYSTYRGS